MAKRVVGTRNISVKIRYAISVQKRPDYFARPPLTSFFVKNTNLGCNRWIRFIKCYVTPVEKSSTDRTGIKPYTVVVVWEARIKVSEAATVLSQGELYHSFSGAHASFLELETSDKVPQPREDSG